MAEEKLVDALKAYLTKTCPSFLGASCESIKARLNDNEITAVLNHFATDSEIPSLTVEKKTDGTFGFDLTSKRSAPDGVAVAFIKGNPKLDPSKALAEQIHICQMNAGAPMESLLMYVRDCFSPYTRSLLDECKSETQGTIIRGINGKLRELEVELLRSQQSALPRVSLEVNPLIAEYIAKNGPKASVSDFPKAKSPALLKDIKDCLNTWKKDIIDITGRTRSIDDGTTVDEINFWMSMEKAVMQIYMERDSPGVVFTFEVLKHNKKFLLITAHNDDIGLAKKEGERSSL
jgi:dynein heavy chain 1